MIQEIMEEDKMITSIFGVSDKIHRSWYNDIPDEKCVGIIGLRGVGKTSFLLKKRLEKSDSIYISCDMMSLRKENLFSIVKELYKLKGIKNFFLDEIHYITDWDGYIKNIFDVLPVNVMFSGSNMLDITKGSYDLSRRALVYHAPYFSFAEYILITKKINIPKINLEDILSNHVQIATDNSIWYTGLLFQHYLQFGQFGYRYTNQNDIIYRNKLNNSIRKIINEDLVNFVSMDTGNLNKVIDLFIFLCNGGGTSPISTTSLGKKLNIHHKTIESYVEFLQRAGMLNRIYPYGNLSDTLRKEKKLFPSSTNMLYLFGNNIGFVRESFFVSCLEKTLIGQNSFKNKLFYQSKTDFILEINNNKYFFEIGGKSKSRKEEKNSFVIKDDITIGQGNNIPLWLFGLL